MSGKISLNRQAFDRLLSSMMIAALVFASITISARPVTATSLHSPAMGIVAQPTVLAVVSTNDSVLFDQPDGGEVQTFESGAVVTAFGRTTDSKWVAVRTENGTAGWMKVSDLVLFGVETLSVLDPANALPGAGEAKTPTSTSPPPTSPPPTSTPTAIPTKTPTKSPPTPTTKPTVANATSAQPTNAAVATRRPASSSLDSQVLAIVAGTGASVRTTPDGDDLETLDPGAAVGVIGRSQDNQWLSVTSDSGTTGWVAVTEVVVFGVELLPIVDGSATTTTADKPTEEPRTEQAPTEEPTVAPPTKAAASTSTKPTTTPAPIVEDAAAVESANGVTVAVRTNGATLNIRSGPGTSYTIIGGAANRSNYAALGRDSASTWVQVDLGSGRTGWLSTGFVDVTGDLASLSVVATTPAAAVVVQPTSTTSTATQPTTEPAPQPVVQSTGGLTGLSGKLVVSSGNGGMFYVYNLETGELRPVTGGYDPAISPDGKQIAFARSGGENGIYVINVDGSGQRKVYGGGELLGSPKWNADSSQIVFSRATSIESCRTPGFGICLPDQPEFSDLPLDNVVRFGLSRIRLNSDDDKFRDIAVVGSAIAPDWDNDNIIYRSDRGFKITKDKPTVDVKDVTFESGLQDPDLYGGQIVYQAKSGNRWEIAAMNDDGKGAVFLTRPETTLVNELPVNVAPAWSPDGKSIVFLSNRGANNSAGPWAVWVMNADGSNQRRLPIEIKISYNYAQEQMVSWGK